MSQLLATQHYFQAFLFHPEHTEIKEYVLGTEKVSVETRLAIYSNAYQIRLVDALADIFPALKAVLGDENFTTLGLAYVDAFPSTYRSIRWFGDQLPPFLSSQPIFASQPYLAELAHLEWTLRLVFDAKEEAPVTIADIAAIPPEQWPTMRLILHPSLRRLDLAWNSVSIWQATEKEEPIGDFVHSEVAVPWVFWRKELLTQFCSLPVDEAWALDSVLRGLCLDDIGTGLCQWVSEEEAPLRVASLLKSWVQAEMIVGVQGIYSEAMRAKPA